MLASVAGQPQFEGSERGQRQTVQPSEDAESRDAGQLLAAYETSIRLPVMLIKQEAVDLGSV